MSLDPESPDPQVEASDASVPGSAAWWIARQELATRRRPRADGLSIDRIVGAAILLVDAEGLPALTVRRLADDLDTGSASLYRHVASREELLVLMVDHVLGEVLMPDAALAPLVRIERLAGELRRVLLHHERLLPALTASPLVGPNAVRGVEVGLTSALDAGFAHEVATAAVLALIDFVLGTVYFDTSSAGRSFAGGVAEPGAPLAPAPLTDDVFAFGLATFLSGLVHRSGSSDIA